MRFDEEKLFEEYVDAKIKRIERLEAEYPHFKVYIDLSEIESYEEIIVVDENGERTKKQKFYGGWRNPTREEIEKANEEGNTGFFEVLANNFGKVPVKTLEVDIRHVPPKERGEYNGYYGWIGSVETMPFVDRNLNCLSRKMDVSPGLRKEIEPYDNVRSSCEGRIRYFNVSKCYYEELIGTLGNMNGKIFDDVFDPYRENNGKISVRFLEHKCANYDTCDKRLRPKRWPVVHIPAPGQSYLEAKTALARAMASAAAGLIAKSLDPAYPDRYGIYTARGYRPTYPIQQELYPSCQTCSMYKYVKRGNEDEDADMRQPGLPEMKDSWPGVDWCRFHQDWIWGMTETRAELGQTGRKSKTEVRRAAECSACSAYMWRVRYIASVSEESKYNPAFESWIASSKAIKLLKDNTILAFAAANDILREDAPALPQLVRLSLQISEKLAEKHKKFSILKSK